jgi:hypothetical protein
VNTRRFVFGAGAACLAFENLRGLNMHSVHAALPEFQHPAIGDTISYGANRMRLERVDDERVLTWRS